MDKKNIKNKIIILTAILLVLLLALISCLFYQKNYPEIPGIEEFKEEGVVGNIEENNFDQEELGYPHLIYEGPKNITGNTSLNLMQGRQESIIYDSYGRIAMNEKYLLYPRKEEDSRFLILVDLISNEKTTILDKDTKFLHIYDDFVLGVLNEGSLSAPSDQIFLYDIKRKDLKIYNTIHPGNIISSFAFDGKNFYFTLKMDGSIYKCKINGKELERINATNIFTEGFKIVDIKDNYIYYKENSDYFRFYIDTHSIEPVSAMDEVLIGNPFKVTQTVKGIQKITQIYYNDALLQEDINTLNYNKEKQILYFSVDNEIFQVKNGEVIIFYKAQTPVNEIYIFNETVVFEDNNVLMMKGDS